jgi:hypothetical protein
MLGWAQGTTVLIDDDGAGYGWFIDATTEDNREFRKPIADGALQAAQGSDAYRRMDLLTVIMHELGHMLGLDHHTRDEHTADLMDATLSAGVRILDSDDDHPGATADLREPEHIIVAWVRGGGAMPAFAWHTSADYRWMHRPLWLLFEGDAYQPDWARLWLEQEYHWHRGRDPVTGLSSSL